MNQIKTLNCRKALKGVVIFLWIYALMKKVLKQWCFRIFDEPLKRFCHFLVLSIIADFNNIWIAYLSCYLLYVFDINGWAFWQEQLHWSIAVNDSSDVMKLFIDLKLLNKELITLWIEKNHTGFFQFVFLLLDATFLSFATHSFW